MTTEATVNGNLVYRDDSRAWRWFDALGPDVCKLVENFVNTPFSAADQPAGWLNTLLEGGAGESLTALLAGSAGGELRFTNDAGDNDGSNLQLLGEAFYFGERYPSYFGCRFQISDATEMDAFAGLCITNATLEAGMTDGLYFRKPDGSATLYLVAEKNSLETAIGIATVAAATWVTAEYYYSGGIVYAYINGIEVAQLADSAPNFPDDEYLTPSLASKNGEAVAKTMSVDWIRAIQVQAVI